MELTFPALQGRFLAAGPPGKSQGTENSWWGLSQGLNHAASSAGLTVGTKVSTVTARQKYLWSFG